MQINAIKNSEDVSPTNVGLLITCLVDLMRSSVALMFDTLIILFDDL